MKLKEIKTRFGKFVEPSAPLRARLMAADGLVPGTFTEITGIRALLASSDPDENVRKKALAGLSSIKREEWKKYLQSLGNEIMEMLIKLKVPPADVVEEAVARGMLSTSGLRMAVLRYGHSPGLLEAVSKRQRDVLQDSQLAQLILHAPGTPQHVKDYICELTGISVQPVPAEEPEKEVEAGAAPEPATMDVEVTDVAEEVEVEELPPQKKESAPGTVKKPEAKPKEKDEPIYKRLLRMSMPEKIRLAETGGEDARSILIKDSNKIVALSVLRNPRLREDEIVSIAASRSVIPEVLQYIASNKKWVKSYSIKLALVNNPKTPIHISMKLLPTLMEKDLKSVKKNRNLPSAVLNQAKKILQQKEQKKSRKA